MLNYLSEAFSEHLIEAGIIDETSRDVYSYGFFQTIMFTINIITTLILAIVFNQLLTCIVLNIVFIPIRINAGGHHAKTPFKCYISSTLIMTLLLLILKTIKITTPISIMILVFSSIIIYILAPVEALGDSLDDIEKIVYRKRTMVILLFEILAFTISLFLAVNWLSSSIVLALFTECTMLIVGKIDLLKNV